MANNFRIPFKNAVVAEGLPKTGAGSAIGAPVRSGGLNGINLHGTGKGVGIPANSTFGVIALDGVAVLAVTVAGAALKLNDPVYIKADGTLTSVATDATLFGYADDANAVGAAVIGVRISNAVGA